LYKENIKKVGIEKFEDIIAWKKSKELTLSIYKKMKGCRDLSFKNQIERACVSVMNNIAEGFERRTQKEFTHFLFIAKGSCGEVRSMLYLSVDLGYISSIECEELSKLSIETSKILSGLIKSL
jgi:four helix bundle protein